MSDKEKDKDKKKEPSGIISCQYSVGGVDKGTINDGDTIFMETNKVHRFYLDPAKGNFGAGTKDKQASANEGKWAYLLNYLWEKAVSIKGNEVYTLWGDIGSLKENQLVPHLGIGNQYKLGSFMEFEPKVNDFWVGNHYRMEVFNNVPNKGFHFNFFPVEKPGIKFAYFDEQVFEPKTDGMGINDGLYHYGQTIDLHMFTHLLPAKFEDKYRIASETNLEDLMLEVVLTDMNGGELLKEPIVKDRLSKFYVDKNGTAANAEFKIPFYIDPKWKGVIHQKDDLEKDYSATLYIKNTKTKAEYSHVLSTKSTQKINETTKELEITKVSWYIFVKYETAEVILKNFEIKKNNQMQYIGDVKYSKKEYDPCGYSKISITEDGGKRKGFDIFDENAAPANMDHTDLSYDIITGDKKKTVLIELGDLKNKGVMCTGVLLEKGQTHSDIRNVFQMKRVVMLLKDVNNKPVLEEDKTHEKQLKKSGIKVTDENKTDSDYKADPTKRVENIDRDQNLKEDRDYIYAADHLKLLSNYFYNKTVGEDVMGYAVDNKVVKWTWVFRYLFLSDDVAQSYYVPVGTCRYPNQLARVRVFPDIKWKVSVLISDKKVPQSLASTGMPTNGSKTGGDSPYHPESKRENVYQEYVTKAKEATDKRKKIGGQTFDFDLTVSCTVNGETEDLGVSLAKKVEKFMGVFVGVKSVVDKLCHNDEKHAQDLMKKLPKSKKVPIYIKFDYPAIKIDGSWEYAVQPEPYHNRVEPSGKISLALEPLIKGEGGIDLIALALILAKGVPVVSQVLTALELIEAGVEFVANMAGYELSRRLEFNVYVFSQIDARVEIPFNTKDYISLQVDGRLGIGAQLKLEAGIAKRAIQFEAENTQPQSGFGLAVDAKGESYLELLGAAGFEKGPGKGFYVEPKVNFGGVKLTIIAKTLGKPDGKNKGKELINKPIWVVEKKNDIIELRRFYPFS